MKKPVIVTFVLAPILAFSLVGCSQSIALPEEDPGPSGGLIPGVGIPAEVSDPSQGTEDGPEPDGGIVFDSPEEQEEHYKKYGKEENEDFKPLPDNYNYGDPATTLPKLKDGEEAFDIKKSMLDDIQATRAQIVTVIGNNNASGMKLDGTAKGSTTLVNSGTKDENLVIYQAVITHPSTVVTTSGGIGDYKIVVENADAGYKVTYSSYTNTYGN